MKNNNFIVGIGLIFLGLAYFLKNFNISMINTFMILGGLYFLYDYSIKKHQPHLIFGIILTLTGALMLLRDLDIFRFSISGEMFLLALGIIFLAIYFRKGIVGFVFPGYILPVLAIYSIIENNFNDNYIWPCFFIMLGLAFYLIYFTAFIHVSSWPLVPGTILILFGVASFAFVLEIITIDMVMAITNYQNYIIAAGIIFIGVLLLFKSLRK